MNTPPPSCKRSPRHRAGTPSRPWHRWVIPLLTPPLTMLTTLATAASPAPGLPNLPVADARTPVPPVIHRSAIPRQTPAASPDPSTWVEANRLVDQIGGWKAYLREAHGQPTPEAPPRAPEAKR